MIFFGRTKSTITITSTADVALGYWQIEESAKIAALKRKQSHPSEKLNKFCIN